MSKNNLKIIFFGTSEFAVPALKLLIESGYNISAVFTGHGPIEQMAKEHGIKTFQPTSLKKAKPRSDAQGASTTGDEQVFEEFKNLKPDICIIAAYGKIIPQKFLDIPKYGFLNIHPSLLPKYRGPSPIQTALLNGDKETGVAIMMVDAEIDHGPFLKQTTYNLKSTAYYQEAETDLAEIGAKLLVETLPQYINGKIKPVEQNHSQATFTKMFSRDDGRINWSESGGKIYNQIRALNPEPGTWTTWKNKVINIPTCDVGYPQVTSLESEVPGMVKKIDGDIAIKAGSDYLVIKSIQLEGRKEMDVKSFLNGHPDFIDSQLK